MNTNIRAGKQVDEQTQQKRSAEESTTTGEENGRKEENRRKMLGKCCEMGTPGCCADMITEFETYL